MDARTPESRQNLQPRLYALCAATGAAPFEERAVAAAKDGGPFWAAAPRPVREVRPDVPAALSNLLHQMIAKESSDRPQRPQEVAKALLPFIKPAARSAPASPMPPVPEQLRGPSKLFGTPHVTSACAGAPD